MHVCKNLRLWSFIDFFYEIRILKLRSMKLLKYVTRTGYIIYFYTNYIEIDEQDQSSSMSDRNWQFQ